MPQLPGAESEALQIASLLGARTMIGEDAHEEAVMRAMPPARLIHFATHGLLVNASWLTFSVMSSSLSADLPPGAVAMAGDWSRQPQDANSSAASVNGFLTSGKILTLDLNADLVTLSACDTARGRTTQSEFQGLPSALLAAGARSVVMTLWTIPDAPTADLMTAFYRELLAGRSKAVALRAAMLATRERHPDPANWAAFTLIGLAD
jgi:CHAT domain-containing protein